MQSTFEIPLVTSTAELDIIKTQASELSRLMRKLFVDIYVNKNNLNSLKSDYINNHGITGRQFNSLANSIDGKVKAWTEITKNVVISLKEKIKNSQKKLKTLQSKKGQASPWKKKSWDATLKNDIHQLKRKIARLEHKLLVQTNRLKGNNPSICFGSRELFLKQFNLEANGYKTHADWAEDWEFARSSQFFQIGVGEESAGCQSVQWNFIEKTVKVRLCNKASSFNNGNEWLTLKASKIPYGLEHLLTAQEHHKPVTTRIVLRKNEKTKVISLKALVSVYEFHKPVTTCRFNGALGVDLNAHSVALAWIKEDGNLLRTSTLEYNLAQKSTEQTENILSNLAKTIVMMAKSSQIPIVCEELDFQSKKRTLESREARYSEMLSGFAYAKFYQFLTRHAIRHGVEVITVNPAFTSIMGYVKFGVGRLSVDESAAYAIARRGLGCTERLRTRSMSPALCTKLTQVSGERHMRHVWSGWRRFSPWLGTARKQWAGRCSAKGHSVNSSLNSASASGAKKKARRSGTNQQGGVV